MKLFFSVFFSFVHSIVCRKRIIADGIGEVCNILSENCDENKRTEKKYDEKENKLTNLKKSKSCYLVAIRKQWKFNDCFIEQ